MIFSTQIMNDHIIKQTVTMKQCAVFMILMINVTNAGFVSWLFGRSSEDNVNNGAKPGSGQVVAPLPRRAVPFEMKTADEKFLTQAVMDLSPLDVCHHRVIARIKTTCSAISEEGLSKLAVDLLNCQSESEKRQTYPCTEEMTISECTKDMDATTWNAYQIVSNRARAICYTTRQQQFQMKTEHTVNNLIETTAGQLNAMNQLKEGQEKISESTTDTLKKMSDGQQQLMTRQNQLKSSQSHIQTHIAANLRELTKEKALIAAGHRELATLTETIKQKLDMTTAELQGQGSEQKKNHEQILKDLANIQHKAKQVWAKIDDASKQVVDFHDETSEHYQQTLENLHKINSTINYVLGTVNDMKTGIEKKLSWLTRLVGGTGDQVTILLITLVHVLYFVMVVVSASFLRTPMFSRMVMLVLIPLNAMSEVRQSKSLGFAEMTLFISITVMANWTVAWLCSLKWRRNVDSDSSRVPRSVMMSPCTCAMSTPPDGSTCPLNKKVTPPTTKPDSAHKYDSLKSPDLKKLISMLEKIYHSGELKRSSSALDKSKLDQNSNSPSVSQSTVKTSDQNLQEQSICESEPSIAAFPTPVADPLDSSVVRELSDPAMVKRQLIHSLEEIVTPSRVRTPGRGSRSSTPINCRNSSRKNSPSRPLCTGTTRSGQLCKLTCVEGKSFCYKHAS